MQHLVLHELMALLRAVADPEHRLMMAVAYWHGLRVSELINLTGSNLKDGYLVLQRLKGSQKTVQKFMRHPDPLLDEFEGLTALSKTRKPNEKLFPSVETRFQFYYLMQVYGKAAGIAKPKRKTHIFKHTIAMHSRNTLQIQELKEHLGHTNISSTGAYLEADQDEVSEKLAAGLGATVE